MVSSITIYFVIILQFFVAKRNRKQYLFQVSRGMKICECHRFAQPKAFLMKRYCRKGFQQQQRLLGYSTYFQGYWFEKKGRMQMATFTLQTISRATLS
jgi:hypothetical protein